MISQDYQLMIADLLAKWKKYSDLVDIDTRARELENKKINREREKEAKRLNIIPIYAQCYYHDISIINFLEWLVGKGDLNKQNRGENLTDVTITYQ